MRGPPSGRSPHRASRRRGRQRAGHGPFSAANPLREGVTRHAPGVEALAHAGQLADDRVDPRLGTAAAGPQTTRSRPAPVESEVEQVEGGVGDRARVDVEVVAAPARLHPRRGISRTCVQSSSPRRRAGRAGRCRHRTRIVEVQQDARTRLRRNGVEEAREAPLIGARQGEATCSRRRRGIRPLDGADLVDDERRGLAGARQRGHRAEEAAADRREAEMFAVPQWFPPRPQPVEEAQVRPRSTRPRSRARARSRDRSRACRRPWRRVRRAGRERCRRPARPSSREDLEHVDDVRERRPAARVAEPSTRRRAGARRLVSRSSAESAELLELSPRAAVSRVTSTTLTWRWRRCGRRGAASRPPGRRPD